MVGFSLVSVAATGSVVGVVVPEAVSVFSGGVGFSVVGSPVVCVEPDVVCVPDGGVAVPEEFSFETVVPEPPEALTEDVGPSRRPQYGRLAHGAGSDTQSRVEAPESGTRGCFQHSTGNDTMIIE